MTMRQYVDQEKGWVVADFIFCRQWISQIRTVPLVFEKGSCFNALTKGFRWSAIYEQEMCWWWRSWLIMKMVMYYIYIKYEWKKFFGAKDVVAGMWLSANIAYLMKKDITKPNIRINDKRYYISRRQLEKKHYTIICRRWHWHWTLRGL